MYCVYILHISHNSWLKSNLQWRIGITYGLMSDSYQEKPLLYFQACDHLLNGRAAHGAVGGSTKSLPYSGGGRFPFPSAPSPRQAAAGFGGYNGGGGSPSKIPLASFFQSAMERTAATKAGGEFITRGQSKKMNPHVSTMTVALTSDARQICKKGYKHCPHVI